MLNSKNAYIKDLEENLQAAQAEVKELKAQEKYDYAYHQQENEQHGKIIGDQSRRYFELYREKVELKAKLKKLNCSDNCYRIQGLKKQLQAAQEEINVLKLSVSNKQLDNEDLLNACGSCELLTKAQQEVEELKKQATSLSAQFKRAKMFRKKNEELKKRVAELEDLTDTVENILYWETCPEDYKKRLANAFGLQDVLDEIAREEQEDK